LLRTVRLARRAALDLGIIELAGSQIGGIMGRGASDRFVKKLPARLS
jgi:hypothetical protein